MKTTDKYTTTNKRRLEIHINLDSAYYASLKGTQIESSSQIRNCSVSNLNNFGGQKLSSYCGLPGNPLSLIHPGRNPFHGGI